MSYMPYDQLPDPSDKFDIGEELGSGFCAKVCLCCCKKRTHFLKKRTISTPKKVYKARDLQNDRTVAVKIQPYDKEHREHIEEEYRILRDHSSYPNLPDFYGTYRQSRSNGPDDIWFVLQVFICY